MGIYNYLTLYLTKSAAELKSTPIKRNPKKRLSEDKTIPDQANLRRSPRKIREFPIHDAGSKDGSQGSKNKRGQGGSHFA